MRVPTYEGEARLPAEGGAVMGNVAQAGMVGKSLKQLGEAGMELATAMKHAADYDALTEMQEQSRLHLNESMDELKKDPANAENWKGSFMVTAQHKLREISELAAGRPEALAAFKRHWSKLYPDKLQQITSAADQQQILNFAGNAVQREPKYVDLYLQETDDLGRARVKGEYIGMITGGEAAGLIHPDKAEKLRQGFDRSVLVRSAQKEAVANPQALLEKLREPEKHFPGMSPDDALSLSGQASGQLHRLQGENSVKAMQMFEAGTLTTPQVREMRDRGDLSLAHAETYEALIEGKAKNQENKSHPDTWVKLNDDILQGRGDRDSVLKARADGRLSSQDTVHLLANQARFSAKEDKADDWWVKTAMQQGKVMLAGGRLDPFGNPEETPAYFKFAFALKKRVEEERLTGEAIPKAAAEIIAPLAADKLHSNIFTRNPKEQKEPWYKFWSSGKPQAAQPGKKPTSPAPYRGDITGNEIFDPSWRAK